VFVPDEGALAEDVGVAVGAGADGVVDAVGLGLLIGIGLLGGTGGIVCPEVA
jgi:hypothetical protein